jgi:RNA polymerase sigma factor (sigma-70 family)
MELLSDTYAFERADYMWQAGLRATIAGRQTEADQEAIVWQAVQAMRQELFERLAWQRGALQEHPRDEVREWGSILFSGVMCSMINTDISRLHTALVRDGEPHHVLLERLPAHVYSAWHDKSWSGLEELRNLIVKLLIADSGSATLSNHLCPESLRKAHQEIAQWGNITSALEEWSALQEVNQRLNAWAAQARLSPNEPEVLNLQRQGLTQPQISTELGISRDDVNTYERRIRTKLRKIVQTQI